MNQNQEELCSHESIWDIPHDKFAIMCNGIVWDINNLCEYIINITKGVNQYDDNMDIYAGQPIWDKNETDLEFIYENFPAISHKLKNYLDCATILTLYPIDELNFLQECGSILWAHGNIFEQKLQDILNEEEHEEWLHKRKGISRCEMPDLSNMLSDKITKLKQEQLFKYYQYYTDLSKRKKDLMGNHNDELNIKNTDKVMNSKNCIMIFGHALTMFCSFIEEHRNKQSNT